MELNPKNPRRILWSVDLFAPEGHFSAQVPPALQAIAHSLRSVVEPVCILDSGSLPPEIEPLSQDRAAVRFSSHAQLHSWQNKVQLPALAPVTLLLSEHASPRAAARRMADYAREVRADIIMVHTHAREGLPRFFRGSFAETLLHISPVPVLVSSPSNRILGDHFEEVLFPTNFSEISAEIFDVITDLVAEMHARLELLHEVDDLYPLLSPIDFMAPIEPQFDARVLVHNAEETAERWKSRAVARGVPLHYSIRVGVGEHADAIVDTARGMVSPLVVLTCGSSLLSASLLGSTAHTVLRHGPCPVLVVHYPAVETARAA
jgi:universal stress protein A